MKEDECTLSQFKPDPKRKTLFSGKTFIFMTEKQVRIEHTINNTIAINVGLLYST